MKKTILKVVAVIVIVGLLGTGTWFYREWSGKKFALAQVNSLRAYEYADIYDNLIPKQQELYENKEDFVTKFGTSSAMEITKDAEYVGKTSTNGMTSYTYQLQRQDNAETGYMVVLKVSNSLIVKNKIADIGVQEGKFLKN